MEKLLGDSLKIVTVSQSGVIRSLFVAHPTPLGGRHVVGYSGIAPGFELSRMLSFYLLRFGELFFRPFSRTVFAGNKDHRGLFDCHLDFHTCSSVCGG